VMVRGVGIHMPFSGKHRAVKAIVPSHFKDTTQNCSQWGRLLKVRCQFSARNLRRLATPHDRPTR